MTTLPSCSAIELNLLHHRGELRDFGPVVRLINPSRTRTLAPGLPVVVVADEPVPDADLSFTPARASDAEALQRVLGTLSSSPQTSTLVAQLLRATESMPISEALVCESLTYSLLQSGSEFSAWLARRDPPAPIPHDEPETVQVIAHHASTEVRVDRPRSANALDQRTRERLAEVFAALSHTAEDLVLSGAGKHFSAGGDLREFGTFTTPVESHLARTTVNPAWAISQVARRLTAQIHGSCIGAGIELSAFASRVIAASDTRIMLPEIAMGLLPGSGGTVSIPRRIGRHRALRLMLDPEGIDAHTALSWGLVDVITP